MRPFSNSPYFVANPLQAHALVRLRQAVTFPGGVAVLSGGPGVGKSAFVRQALAPADSDVQLLPVDLRSAEPGEFIENRQLADGSFLSVYNELYHASNGANYISVYLSPLLREPAVVGVSLREPSLGDRSRIIDSAWSVLGS